MRDPYQCLGVSRSVSQDELKKAYRRLVKELHPDVNPGDTIVEQRFKEVSAAYELLKDPERRARYDAGEIDAEGRERHPFQRGRGGGRRAGGFGPHDIFDDLFRRGNFRSKGLDVSYSMEVDFIEAAKGARKRLDLTDGKTLQVTIPPGARDGQTLRLKQQGMSSISGGQPGDAFVQIHVRPHPHFRREDDDIHLDLPVTIDEAALGATVMVPTIDGKVSLKIPAGANTGTRLRLKEKGIPGTDGQRGHQYVRLQVTMPDRIDRDLADFLQSWRRGHAYDPRRKAGL